MAGLLLGIAADSPRHVTRRGDQRQVVSFGADEGRFPIASMVEPFRASGVAVRAWCLGAGHGRSILVPLSGETPEKAIAVTRREKGIQPGGTPPSRTVAAPPPIVSRRVV